MTVMPRFGEQKYRAPYFLISLFPSPHPRWAESTDAGWLSYRNSQVSHRPLRRVPHISDPARVSHPTGTSSLSAGTDKNRTRARLHFVQLLRPFVNGLTDPLFPRKLGHPCATPKLPSPPPKKRNVHYPTHPMKEKKRRKKEGYVFCGETIGFSAKPLPC